MLFTAAQLHEIKEIIKDYHDAFIINAVDDKALPEEIIKRLKEKGLIDPQVNSIKDAYLYGQVLAMLETKQIADMSYPEFKAYVKKNPIPLTAVERQAAQMAALHAGQYCQGLGNKIGATVGSDLIEADSKLRARLETDIRTATAENIVKRETVKQLKTDLGWKTKDWARDWDRIAVTEKQTAMQEGVADGIRKEHGGEAYVSKIPQPGACNHCLRLHVGPDGNPRIFKLSTLENNGTNFGKKAQDWDPVVGAVHPNCQCTLVRVPKGWGYDEEGILVPGGKGGVKYEDEQAMSRAVKAEDDLQKSLAQFDIQFTKSGSNGLGSNIVLGGDFLERNALVVKGDCFFSWPEAARTIISSWACDRETMIKKDFSDACLRRSQSTGNFTDALTFIPEENSFIQIPHARTPMFPTVFRGCFDLQVGDRVIKAVPVFVVDQLGGKEWAAQMALHNNPMFKALSAIIPDKPVLCFGIRELSDVSAFKSHEAQDILGDNKRQGIANTKPKTGEMGKSGIKLVLPVEDTLLKAGKVGGKYIRRVPYTDKNGKQRYRYFYAESAVARDVKAGESIRLGEDLVQVEKVEPNGTVHLRSKNQTFVIKGHQWSTFVSEFYGQAYFKWAEKRAMQSVNAVLQHVPRELLGELKGSTDKARLADLKKRVPDVYTKLQKSFSRAGVNPFRAKEVIGAALERRGWEVEARAAVIGDVITKRNNDYRTTIRAAENLAGGKVVKLGHVAAVTEIRREMQAVEPEPTKEPPKKRAKGKKRAKEKPKEEPKDPIAEVAEKAEKEISKLSALLEQARGGTAEDAAQTLATALSSESIQKLLLIAKAFPGLADKAIEPAREVMLQVPSVATVSEPKAVGSSTTVFVAGEAGQAKGLTARYKLMEADDVIASHDPRSFNQRKDYPEGIQERAYHRDKMEQAKVMRNAQRLSPEFVVNTNPDAVNGPPIMSADGVVLGGNSRTMSMQLAYAKHPEKADQLRAYLAEHAHETGFSPEDVKAFKNPILVRVVDEGGNTKTEKQLLVRQMNESFTQSMDPRTMQVAMGRKLTDTAVEALGEAMDADETLGAFLGKKKADPFITELRNVGLIDQRNANQYFDKDGTMNADGKTLVSRVLVGRMIGDADLLSATRPSIIENLAQSVPYMAQAQKNGKGYDLGDDIRVSLDAYNYLQNQIDRGTAKALKPDMSSQDFKNLFAQMGLGAVEEEHPVTKNSRAMSLLEVMIRRPGKNQISKLFRGYAAVAKENPEGQAGLLGAARTPIEVFNEVVQRHLKSTGPKKAKPTETPEQEAAGSLFMSVEPSRPLRQPSFAVDSLRKAGPFIGPRGGKWADAKMTIPWKEEKKSPLIGLKLEIKPHEKMGMYDVTFHVVDAKDGKVRLSKDKDGEFGPWVPEESLSHLKNDLEGKVDLPVRSKNETVNAVLDGKAEFLGKGDDGLAFRVGDKVVKVSTPVPYHPENNMYLTPEKAVDRLRKQAEVGNELADIKGVQRSEFISGHGKGFQIKDWVEIPKKFTREQLDQIQKTVIEIHKRGYSINDTIQPGLDKNGEPVLFDIGKADKARGTGMMSDKESDMSNLSLLYRDSGEHFVRLDVDKTKQAWQHFEGMLKHYLETESFDYARKKLDKAVAKREKDIRAKYKGKELKAELDLLDFEKDDLMFDIEHAEKKAGKPELTKGLNATIATAGTYSGDKSPGPGLGVNYAIKTPSKKKPKRKQIKDEDDPTGMKRALKNPNPRATQTVTIDKATYTGFRGVNTVHKYVLPEQARRDGIADEISRNRGHLEREIERHQTPGNRVNIKREQE